MNYSVEFCGGTHLSNLAQAKFFAIVEEGSISKGIRRIVAITGDRANESIVLANQIQGMLSHARSLHGKELEAAVTELQQLLPTAVISVPTKVAMYALVAKEKASKTFSAKTWISEVAAVSGGKGGGSPMQAQGQSKDTSNVAAAFEKAKEILQANL